MVSFQKRPDSELQSKEFKNNNQFILGVPFSVKKTKQKEKPVVVQKYLSENSFCAPDPHILYLWK